VEGFSEAFQPGDLGADDASGNGEIGASRRLPRALLGHQEIAHGVRMTRSVCKFDTPLPRRAQLMREDVLLRPASEIKQNAMRQEIKAGAGQLLASLARQHCVESAAQRVQVQHVRSSIAKLLFAQ